MTVIGVTMGCPVGIGPEIILKFFSDFTPSSDLQVVVLGDLGVLRKCASDLGIPTKPIRNWHINEQIEPDIIPVLSLSDLNVNKLHWGQPNLDTAKAMARYIEEGVHLIQSGFLEGITTCPISKYSLNKAGYLFPGHTEMLADLTNSSDFVMMMAGDKLRVTLATIHCAFKEVPQKITAESLSALIAITSRSLRDDFGIRKPRIAVAGLNPHGGEDTLFGDEENELIAPAVRAAQNQGFDVTGPYPPDTLFYKAAKGDFDAVVCMYHDQGLIPFKLLHFEDGVNVTLGLPIVRTSVDHGTAYDIAGKGYADQKSLSEAVKMAAMISENRKKNSGDIKQDGP